MSSSPQWYIHVIHRYLRGLCGHGKHQQIAYAVASGFAMLLNFMHMILLTSLECSLAILNRFWVLLILDFLAYLLVLKVY